MDSAFASVSHLQESRDEHDRAVAMSNQELSLYFRLDKSDRITETGGAWDTMAHENGGDALCGGTVIGHPLYDYVSGDVSKMFVRTVIDGVRVLQRPRALPYRCDSPGLRRYMEMAITCEPGGGLLLEHRLLRTEATGRRFDFQTSNAPLRQMIVRCTHCNAIKHEGRWGEPEAVLPEQVSGALAVVYGVCPRCMERIRRK